MRKATYISIGLVVVIILVFTGLFLTGSFTPKNAALLIDTNPKATVFIDGVRVGVTPYEGTRRAGEVLVKLVPETQERPLAPFETRATLASGIKTVIRRDFGDSDETSSSEIISFEKVSSGEVSLAVISIPDSAQISVDGKIYGFAPYKTSKITAGEHQLAISAQGYSNRTLAVRTFPGYRLTAIIKLAMSPQPTAPSQPVIEKKTFVEILSTPTGFLRVREKPSVTAKEVGQVKPGQKYPFVDEDSQSGWFEIEYLPAQAGLPGKNGWISNRYGKKVEETITSSPTPSPTASPSSSSKQS